MLHNRSHELRHENLGLNMQTEGWASQSDVAASGAFPSPTMASTISAITFNNSTLNDVQGNYYNYNAISMPGERGKVFTTRNQDQLILSRNT